MRGQRIHNKSMVNTTLILPQYDADNGMNYKPHGRDQRFCGHEIFKQHRCFLFN